MTSNRQRTTTGTTSHLTTTTTTTELGPWAIRDCRWGAPEPQKGYTFFVAPHEYDSTWPYDAYGPCPCGSGNKAKFCCRAGRNKWVTPRRRLGGKESESGYDHPKCFAAGTGCCDEKLSGEHYVSESVLKLFGPTVNVTGFVFAAKEVGTGSLKAKMLCKAHNEMLSPLDATSVRLFGNLVEFVRTLTGRGSTNPRLFLLNGDDVEHALLKVLCGLAASRAIEGLATTRPPQAWVDVLYARKPWPAGWALYVERTSDGIRDGILDGLMLGLRLDERGVPYQLGIRVVPWQFVLHVDEDSGKTPGSNFVRRPDLLITQKLTTRFGIGLTYSTPGPGGWVRATIHPD